MGVGCEKQDHQKGDVAAHFPSQNKSVNSGVKRFDFILLPKLIKKIIFQREVIVRGLFLLIAAQKNCIYFLG